MRLPTTAHTSRPWRIHELTPDFRLEDVWALPTPGGPHDLDRLMRQFTSPDDSYLSAPIVRTLFTIRWRLGALFGWDKPCAGTRRRMRSLRERLPVDLRVTPQGPDLRGVPVPFTSVYKMDNEWAAEIVNATVHGVLHIGWVPDGTGGYRGQMAVLVKPNGLLGRIYMAGIAPLRHLVVYPRLIRAIGHEWDKHRTGERPR
jgi:Protein of unknown function (DUF2867)